MKELKLYQCEHCHTQYAKEADALKCEEYHKIPKKVKIGRCHPFTMNDSSYPLQVIVTFDDKKSFVYKRTNIEQVQVPKGKN